MLSTPMVWWKTFISRNKLILIYKILNDHIALNLKDLYSVKNVTNPNAYILQNNEIDLKLAKPKPEFLKELDSAVFNAFFSLVRFFVYCSFFMFIFVHFL